MIAEVCILRKAMSNGGKDGLSVTASESMRNLR